MIKVTICPLGYLAAPFDRKQIEVEVVPGTEVGQVLEELKVRTDLVMSVVINDVTAKRDAVLNDGDIVKLVPVISGGQAVERDQENAEVHDRRRARRR